MPRKAIKNLISSQSKMSWLAYGNLSLEITIHSRKYVNFKPLRINEIGYAYEKYPLENSTFNLIENS